jgi:hypothetical protein
MNRREERKKRDKWVGREKYGHMSVERSLILKEREQGAGRVIAVL